MAGQETEAWLAQIEKVQVKEDVDIDQAIDFNPYNNAGGEEKKQTSPRGTFARSPTRQHERHASDGKHSMIEKPGKFSK